jgi:threonine/homoserine/homoserine lactone efflux protein
MKRRTMADMAMNSTSTLLAIAGIVTVASITPGPNNLLVMRSAVRSGASGALASIAGVIVGGLALLALILGGLQAVFDSAPIFRSLVVVAGSAYLGWLGLSMLRPGPVTKEAHMNNEADSAARRLVTAATFQFLNPKSWVLVLSASAAAQAGAHTVFLEVGALLVIIPAICLTIWATLGVILMRLLSHERQRRHFDRGMGILLMVSAAFLLRSI